MFVVVVVVLFSLSSLPPYVIFYFIFIFGLLANSYPLLACLIRAAILNFSFVCICLHPDAMSLVVLISDLLCQSAAIVFLDGGRVSVGLVWLSVCSSLAQLFLLLCGSYVKLSQELFYSFKGKCGATQ